MLNPVRLELFFEGHLEISIYYEIKIDILGTNVYTSGHTVAPIFHNLSTVRSRRKKYAQSFDRKPN